MISRRTLLKMITYAIPVSVSSSTLSFLGKNNTYRVRYVYRGEQSASHLIDIKRLMAAPEVIKHVDGHFKGRGDLLSFVDQSTSAELIYDYVFVSEEAHFQWEETMRRLKALNLDRFPNTVTVQNFTSKGLWASSSLDRQITIEIS